MTTVRFYPAVDRFTGLISFVRSGPGNGVATPPRIRRRRPVGPFAASLRYRIDGAFVVANAQLPDSPASDFVISAAASPFNPHSCGSVRGGLVQHVFSLPSRRLSPCPSRYRPVSRRQAKNALLYADIGIRSTGVGHPSRLARDLTGVFGSSLYAHEELVAEMTSAFVCAALDRADGAACRLHRLLARRAARGQSRDRPRRQRGVEGGRLPARLPARSFRARRRDTGGRRVGDGVMRFRR